MQAWMFVFSAFVLAIPVLALAYGGLVIQIIVNQAAHDAAIVERLAGDRAGLRRCARQAGSTD